MSTLSSPPAPARCLSRLPCLACWAMASSYVSCRLSEALSHDQPGDQQPPLLPTSRPLPTTHFWPIAVPHPSAAQTFGARPPVTQILPSMTKSEPNASHSTRRPREREPICSIPAPLAVLPLVQSIPLSSRSAPGFVFRGDPAYGVSTAALSGILTCPTAANATSKPVLLVHGTGSTGSESWAAGYVPALQAQGYTPCYIDLPDRSMGDMQVSAAYIVAYNIHYLSSMAGGKQIGVISHSQGGPDVQWALRFWPSTRKIIKSFIALSPDMSGVDSSSFLYQLCTLDLTNALSVLLCTSALWQQAAGSDFYRALNYKKGTFVPTTTIYTASDGVVLPPGPNALLPGGAVTASVQEFCPTSNVDHTGMLVDHATFRVAINALDNGGAANLNVVRSTMQNSTCEIPTAPDMDANLVTTLRALLGDLVAGILLSGPKTKGEPPVKDYALIKNQNDLYDQAKEFQGRFCTILLTLSLYSCYRYRRGNGKFSCRGPEEHIPENDWGRGTVNLVLNMAPSWQHGPLRTRPPVVHKKAHGPAQGLAAGPGAETLSRPHDRVPLLLRRSLPRTVQHASSHLCWSAKQTSPQSRITLSNVCDAYSLHVFPTCNSFGLFHGHRDPAVRLATTSIGQDGRQISDAHLPASVCALPCDNRVCVGTIAPDRI
ncbi:hypothetical protein FH972_022079 [Carpinus fangiana]|uniref:AB hydrolase-1 domain-containing protein n=1 Tax=Carpinus fangiana TaxID=176857 RepID=A0A5N6KRQ6_9ROSI|nr:hypothetical protein FH972_022079 [Carpinus fangiana]